MSREHDILLFVVGRILELVERGLVEKGPYSLHSEGEAAYVDLRDRDFRPTGDEVIMALGQLESESTAQETPIERFKRLYALRDLILHSTKEKAALHVVPQDDGGFCVIRCTRESLPKCDKMVAWTPTADGCLVQFEDGTEALLQRLAEFPTEEQANAYLEEIREEWS